MNTKVSLFLVIAMLLSLVGMATPQPALAQNPTKFAVFEFFSSDSCPACGEAGIALDQLADDYSNRPVAFIEFGSFFQPENRKGILKESGGGNFYPEVMVDSSHEWDVGMTYASAKGYVDRSMARPAGADIQAVYSRSGGTVRVMATVSNMSGLTLSSANKAAVHVIVYEEANIHKTGRVGRASTKTNIGFLQNGHTDTYIIDLVVNSVTDWSKAHVIVLVDYKPEASKKTGVYDQLQAAVASPGTVTPPTTFSVNPERFNFTLSDQDTTLPTGRTTVTLPEGNTWTAETDVDWLEIDTTSGSTGGRIGFTVTSKEQFKEGMNYGYVIVTESGSGRQRGALVAINYGVTPPTEFNVTPETITHTIDQDDSPGPQDGVNITGDEGQVWRASTEQAWIKISTRSGLVPGDFKVTFDRTKLVNGLNEGEIIVRDSGGFHEKVITVSITYTGEEVEPPELDKLIYIPLLHKK